MNGIKRYYEQYHHVQVPAEVLSAVVTLSERYITDRFLPDKAIDLLDEACACCNLAHPVISEYLGMQKELDALKQEEAEMESADVNEAIDYERVAERKTRIAKLESELPAKQAAASEIQVTMDDVAKVIELWTGIPAVKIRETEFVKLAGLEAALKQKSSVRTKPCIWWRRPSSAAAPTFPAAAVPQASSLWAPPAWARPSWSSSWQNSCSTAPTRSSVWT